MHTSRPAYTDNRSSTTRGHRCSQKVAQVRFNSRLRDECLNINSFWSLAHARVVISDWKHDYNHHRRHSSLGYLPPARYAATCTHR